MSDDDASATSAGKGIGSSRGAPPRNQPPITSEVADASLVAGLDQIIEAAKSHAKLLRVSHVLAKTWGRHRAGKRKDAHRGQKAKAKAKARQRRKGRR